MYMMILYCLMQIIKIFILPTYKIIKRIRIKYKKVISHDKRRQNIFRLMIKKFTIKISNFKIKKQIYFTNKQKVIKQPINLQVKMKS